MVAQVLRGTLKPNGTLELWESPQLPAGDVEITLRPINRESPVATGWWSYLQRARAEAESEGTANRSEYEIEAERQQFREEGESPVPGVPMDHHP